MNLISVQELTSSPQDAEDFEEARNDPDYDPETDIRLWIFKPSASSCGKGIRILTRTSEIPTHKKGFVISDYIANPHLIEGLKYDLRVYVLVTNYDPLTVYMYNDGLARFATGKYTLDESSFEDKFVHLTNYSVQK
jgi:tubulin polyglutamylase TTLL4